MSEQPGHSPPGLGLLSRFYRTVLVLYPSSWRCEDLDDLVVFFEESCRRGWMHGRWAGAAHAILAGYADALRSGLAERVGERLKSGRTYGEKESGMDEMVAGILRDVRMGFRSLVRSPGFTLVCVLTLALGIGPNTALFTVLRGLVLAPLPYPEAERLVAIRRDLVVRGIPNYPATRADLIDYREHTDAFQAIAGYSSTDPILTDGDRTERLTGITATPELFEVLGVMPALGRGFTREEGISVAGADDEAESFPVVLSHQFWVRRFGADPDIIGRTVSFGPATAEVIGVMPEDFRLTLSPDDGVPAVPDVILPLTIDPDAPRTSFFLRTIGRLAPGISFDKAVAQMEMASAWQRTQYPSAQAAGTRVRLVPK